MRTVAISIPRRDKHRVYNPHEIDFSGVMEIWKAEKVPNFHYITVISSHAHNWLITIWLIT